MGHADKKKKKKNEVNSAEPQYEACHTFINLVNCLFGFFHEHGFHLRSTGRRVCHCTPSS